VSTGVSKETLALFHRGLFWDAMASYILERRTKAADAALDALSWDDVQQKKGAYAELGVLKRLQADVEKDFRETKTAKES